MLISFHRLSQTLRKLSVFSKSSWQWCPSWICGQYESISLWMISGCLLAQTRRETQAVKSLFFAYDAVWLFTILRHWYLTKIAFSNWIKAYLQPRSYEITIKCWLHVNSVWLQGEFISILLYTLIVLNCSKRGHINAKWCLWSYGLIVHFLQETEIFLCPGKWCEVRVEHEQNLITSSSGEGRRVNIIRLI